MMRAGVASLGLALLALSAGSATAQPKHRFATALAWSPDGRLAVAEGTNVRVFAPGGAREVARLVGHRDEVGVLAWSRAGVLASAGRDERVLVWDVATRQVLRELGGHGAWLGALAWSPDGRRVATAGGDKRVHVWEVASGREQVLEGGHAEGVMAVAWSPDGAWLASTGDDTRVKLWEMPAGRQVASLEAHTMMVQALAWSPDGAWLASAGRERTVMVWDVAGVVAELRAPPPKKAAKKKRVPVGPGGPVLVLRTTPARALVGAGEAVFALEWTGDGAAAEPDKAPQPGSFLVAGTARGALVRWTASVSASGGVRWSGPEVVAAGAEWVHAVAMGGMPVVAAITVPTGPDAGAGDAGGADAAAASPTPTLAPTPAPRPTPPTRLLAVADWNGATRAGALGALRVLIASNPVPQRALAWARDGKSLVTGGPGLLVQWNFDGRTLGAPRFVHTAGTVRGLAMDGGARVAITGTAGAQLLVPAAARADGAAAPTPRGFGPALDCRAVVMAEVDLDRSRSRIATGCDDGAIQLWDLAGGRGRSLTGHTRWVTALALDAGATRLASGADDREVRLWDTQAGKLLTTLTGHSDAIRAVAFDGDLVVSASADATVRVWQDGAASATYHQGSDVLAIAVGPDHVIAAGDHVGTIRLWPAGTTLVAHAGPVRALAFSPSGAVLASTGDDGVVRLWTAAGRPLLSRSAIETLASPPQSVKMAPGMP